MNTVLRAMALILVIMVAAPEASAQTRQPAAGGAAAMTGADGLQAEEMAKFRQWRESIPDYEKRLYDRVKTLNSRVVRLTNVVIAGFVLLLIIAPLGLYLVISQVNAAPLPAANAAGEGASADARSLQRLQREHQRVMERQNEIRRLLMDVQGFMKAHEASLEDLNRDKARIDGVIRKCAAMVEEIEARITAESGPARK